MKKTYMLEDLCCANCASKIETDTGKIGGVTCANVNFMTQKLMVEYDETAEKELSKKVKKIVKKYEPDIEVKEI